MSDQWLSYADAAKALGMTPESVRQRARREAWRRQIGNDGRALILVPMDTARIPAGDTPGNPPASRPALRPERDTAVLRAQLQEIEARAAELRSDLERERTERLQERERADRLASEITDLARQLAKITEEAGDRERDLQARLSTAQAEYVAELLALRERMADAEQAWAEAERTKLELTAVNERMVRAEHDRDQALERLNHNIDRLNRVQAEHHTEIAAVRDQLTRAEGDRNRAVEALAAHLALPWWRRLLG